MDKREEIALKYGLCKCDEIYTSRNMVAPDCPYHSMCVTEAMDEYMKECCLELIDYFGNNSISHAYRRNGVNYFLCKGEELTKEQLFQNFL